MPGHHFTGDEFEALTQPPSDASIVWRYMDYAQFVSLLVEGAIHFTMSAKLGDEHEGVWPEASRQHTDGEFAESGFGVTGGQNVEALLKYYEARRQTTFISCWNACDEESFAMWASYTRNGHGVAIQSTLGRLRKSLNDPSIKIKKVVYANTEIDVIPNTDPTFLHLHKRKFFKAEEEVRGILQFGDGVLPNLENYKFGPNGIYVSVELAVLINKIYVSPKSDFWVLEAVWGLLKQFGLYKKVDKSVI